MIKINNSKIHIEGIIKKINFDGKLYWGIIWIKGTAKNALLNMLEIEKRINDSEIIIPLSISELETLLDNIDDLYEIILIADSNKNKIVKYIDDETMKRECFITIEKIDSSFYEITSNNIIDISTY